MGIRLLVFPGTGMDYDAHLDEVLAIPFVGLQEEPNRQFVEQSLPDRVVSYLQSHISRERLDGIRRRRRWYYPQEVIRELVVNTYAHRNWTQQTDVQIAVFADRLEITSPGSVSNGIIAEKEKAELHVPRNPDIVNIIRYYDFMEHRVMRITRKMIPLMKGHDDSEPDFEATENYLKAVL